MRHVLTTLLAALALSACEENSTTPSDISRLDGTWIEQETTEDYRAFLTMRLEITSEDGEVSGSGSARDWEDGRREFTFTVGGTYDHPNVSLLIPATGGPDSWTLEGELIDENTIEADVDAEGTAFGVILHRE